MRPPTSRRLLLAFIALSALPGLAPWAAAQGGTAGIDFELLPLDHPGVVGRAGPAWRVVGGAEASPERPLRLDTAPGGGVLAYIPGGGAASHFVSDWEHGDLELELEFLLAPRSSSGVYLQGRYEVQLRDSWGVSKPTSTDLGAIHPRWDESRPEAERGFEGHPPRLDAGRAPGIWQTLKILFRAPRFDARGVKVENARFAQVELNGVPIHENVEVTGPTRGAAFDDERPAGPLMIQADSGPIAFRNVRYKRYTGERVRLSNLRYRAFHGEFAGLETATAGAPVREGTVDAISTAVAEAGDRFAVVYEGFADVPTTGTHAFELHFEWVTPDPGFTGRVVGGGRLSIGGREVLVHDGLRPSVTGRVQLSAGRHPFTLSVYKNRPWIDQMRGVSLWVEGPGVERHPLHELGPVAVAAPILVQPGAEPVVLRGFVEHGGDVLTHAVSVGDPEGVHYGYDTELGALLHGWRGPFVETTEMWQDRGERQVARPLGSVLHLPRAATVAILPDEDAAWPDSAGAGEYRFRGYALDEAGRPTFLYTLGDLEVEDRIRPGESGGSLRRDLGLRGVGAGLVYVRIAHGDRIRSLGDDTYAVGDPGHYVQLEAGTPRPLVRRSGGREELLVPVRLRDGTARVGYSILW